MSKKVVFAVQLEDNAVVETRFRKNDWRQIEYLAGKAYRREGEAIMLSILMYPAVWSVENAIWQRDYGHCSEAGECSSMHEITERISEARRERYEKARGLVKEALRCQSQRVYRIGLDDIKLKKHKFVLAGEAGREDLVVAIPKDDWGMLWAVCSRNNRKTREAVVSVMTLPMVFATRDLVWERDYAYLFKCEPASRSLYEFRAEWDIELGLKSGLITTVRGRLFHCMD